MFDYTAPNLDVLQKTLTAERLGRYLQASNGDILSAIKLYETNIGLSSLMYSVIYGLEVALRNQFHAQLTSYYTTENWFDMAPLDIQGSTSVARARGTLITRRKPITAGRLVAELTFGFWSSLTSKRYSQNLWIPCLHKAFTGKALGHKDASKRLEKVRDLRNRIAHLEPIFDRKLEDEYDEILLLTSWLCPVTSEWLSFTCPRTSLVFQLSLRGSI